MWKLSDERLLVPADFQDRLTEIGGLNRYDQPNFKVVWGNTHTIRTAGWNGYKDTLMSFGDKSWLLLRWIPPEHIGTPEAWAVQEYDEASGLSLRGEYPYMGEYVILFNLSHRYIENGEMKIYRFPLCNLLLDQIVPLIMEAKNVTIEQNKAWWEAEQDRKDADIELMIEQIRKSKKLAFKGGAISYTNQGIRTSYIDQKMQQLSIGWSAAAARLLKAGLGFQQGEL
jgi:hypothetical protein